jgi:hypothetical protein
MGAFHRDEEWIFEGVIDGLMNKAQTYKVQNDLSNPLLRPFTLHPDLLGLGLDQSTSITVHGDNLTVNGPMRVAVWDGKDHDGKGFYYLHTGDQLNTATRVATIVPHPAETTDK